MGYNTTVLILNDGFRAIERDPEAFVLGIGRYMNEGKSFGVGHHANCVQVMRTDHADTFRLYGSHGNLMIELSHWSPETYKLASDPHSRDVVKRYIREAKDRIARLEEFIDKVEGRPAGPAPRGRLHD